MTEANPDSPAATNSDQRLSPLLPDLQRYLTEHIPLCRAMALEVSACTAGELIIRAPLAPNINDKGCAFGGATAALLTIAGWGALWLLTHADGLRCDLLIRQSQLRYLRPAYGTLQARCALPGFNTWQSFTHTLAQRGKARIVLEPVLESDAQLASVMTAEYAGLQLDEAKR